VALVRETGEATSIPVTGSVGCPSPDQRRAAASFIAIPVNNDTLTLGHTAFVTYKFVNALGGAILDTVQVKIQGTANTTCAVFVNAVSGIIDAVNIAYGTGVGAGANPEFRAYYTEQRGSIELSTWDTAAGGVGATAMFYERTYNDTTACTFAASNIASITCDGSGIIRTYTSWYPIDLPAGSALFTLVPLGFFNTLYRPEWITCDGQNTGFGSANNISADLFYSFDEVNFVTIARGVVIYSANFDSVPRDLNVPVIPARAGLYMGGNHSGVGVDFAPVKVRLAVYSAGRL
jgi:hypothetical protein